MGTISRAKASVGLTASGAPTKTNVTGAVEIGVPQFPVEFPDANIAYSLKMTATGANDDIVFDLEDYGVTLNSGTPTLTDADGNDFEGKAMANTATIYALLLTAPATNAGKVYMEEPSGWSGESDGSKAYYSLNIVKEGRAMQSSLKSFALTIVTSGDSLELTVIGKTA
jgi:hypothetical protein